MLRHHTPEIGIALDKLVFFCHALFKIRVGMHINLYGKARVKDHFHGGVEIAEVLGCTVLLTGRIHHGLRIHA